ncbi:MAG: DHH family phosphoesterase [Bacilli bacterium]|nr:DHH family phosphoesterase [Bacilli bacterium]
MEDLRTRLLQYYDLTEEDCARITREPSFSSIPTIENELSAVTAKNRILQAIKDDERILIYGDYDTDGIMATSIMLRCFHILGKTASFFIPSRYIDGYGLTMENAKKIAKSGYSLLILVDNGVGCLQEVSYLLSQGVETIIIDHHELPSVLPPALATIHPDLLPYGQVPVSAGYLCFLFSICLLDKADDYLLTLGAVSTISDCMPMKYHNRELVALALRNIRKNKYPQVMYLAERSVVDESTLSMTVIPTINAVGRMIEDHKISRVVHYFAEFEHKDLSQTADWMKKINEDRKAATKAAMERLRPEPELPAIVVVGRLQEGLNGLLANRLLNEYNKPVACFSQAKSDPDLYVGSLRSKPGFDVMDFEASVSELLVKGGGHAFAGGVSIKKSDYGAFKDAFEKYAFRHPLEEEKKRTVPLLLSEVSMDTYRIIRSFGPFGYDYLEPEFLIENLPVSSLRFSQDGRFLSTPLGKGVRLFSFSYGKPSLINSNDKVSLSGTLKLDEFRGQLQLTFRCEKK